MRAADPGQIAIRVLRGPDLLHQLGARLDELHAVTSTPVTARRSWLKTWLQCYPRYEPWCVVVESGGILQGAAALATRRTAGASAVVAVGHGPSDQIRLPVRDGRFAEALADGVRAELAQLSGPWRLHLDQLPVSDPVAAALVHRVPAALQQPGDLSPTVRFGPDRSIRCHVSRNHHQLTRRMTNRLRQSGLQARVGHLTAPGEVADVLPEVEQVYRARDAALGRRCDLDQTAAGAFFRSVLLEHAQRGEVVLTTMRLDGRLAAYVVCFVDGSAHRMWNCRFLPDYGWLSPGHLANDAALEYALSNDRLTEFDWMRGEERYKMSTANAVVPAERLTAWSSPLLRNAEVGARQAKRSIQRLLPAHSWARQVSRYATTTGLPRLRQLCLRGAR